jgi:hypothetical protein
MLRATSVIVRWSLMTKATAWALYSGVNRRRVDPMIVSPDKPGGSYLVSTKPGTVHVVTVGQPAGQEADAVRR